MSIDTESTMHYIDQLKEQAKTDPVGAGTEYAQALMRWSPDGRLGYTLGSALIATQESLSLTDRETAAVAGKIVAPLLAVVDGLLEERKRYRSRPRLADDVRHVLVQFGKNPFVL